VKKTGLYTLLLANCDNENPADIMVTGQTVWMNPYGKSDTTRTTRTTRANYANCTPILTRIVTLSLGYLPGELYGMMPFFGVLAGIYTLVGIIWAIMCYVNRKDLMLLQVGQGT
jgi:hypothetical protein